MKKYVKPILAAETVPFSDTAQVTSAGDECQFCATNAPGKFQKPDGWRGMIGSNYYYCTDFDDAEICLPYDWKPYD